MAGKPDNYTWVLPLDSKISQRLCQEPIEGSRIDYICSLNKTADVPMKQVQIIKECPVQRNTRQTQNHYNLLKKSKLFTARERSDLVWLYTDLQFYKNTRPGKPLKPLLTIKELPRPLSSQMANLKINNNHELDPRKVALRKELSKKSWLM